MNAPRLMTQHAETTAIPYMYSPMHNTYIIVAALRSKIIGISLLGNASKGKNGRDTESEEVGGLLWELNHHLFISHLTFMVVTETPLYNGREAESEEVGSIVPWEAGGLVSMGTMGSYRDVCG
jgi:hypothetical protein